MPKAYFYAKEVHFFDNPERMSKGASFYYRRFPRMPRARGQRTGQKTYLDATPNYLFVAGTASNIKKLYPQQTVRFLAIVRDPIARSVSQFNHHVIQARHCAKDGEGIFGQSLDPVLSLDPGLSSLCTSL